MFNSVTFLNCIFNPEFRSLFFSPPFSFNASAFYNQIIKHQYTCFKLNINSGLKKYRNSCLVQSLFFSLHSITLIFVLIAIFTTHALNAATQPSRSTPFISKSTTTYLGGSNNESAYAIAIDKHNNIIVAGKTNSDFFDGFNLRQPKNQFNQNCFVLKISASTSSDNFYFELAGSERETCREIALDSEDNIYLTGETQSSDLPVTTAKNFGGEWDAFLIKLSNTGTLLYASYLGGSLTDYGHGLAVKSIDEVYVAGETWSPDFPTTSNAFMSNCIQHTSCDMDKDKSKANAFLTHVDTSQPAIFQSRYSTYLGGNNQDKAHDLAIDHHGHLHIVGETRSSDFPLYFTQKINEPNKRNQLRDSLNGTYDGFLTIIAPEKHSDESLIMSTYIGGSHNDAVLSVTTDLVGTSYISGETWSDDFPVSDNAFSSSCANGAAACNPMGNIKSHTDAFVSVISHGNMDSYFPAVIPNSSAEVNVLYSSLFGGKNSDVAQNIFIKEDSIYVAGTTFSADFPVTNNAIRSACNKSVNCENNSDGFIIKIDLKKDNIASLTYGSYLGGDNMDSVFSLAQNNNNSIFLTGETYSSDLTYSTNSSADTIFPIDRSIENGEAFLQQISILDDGTWVDSRVTPPSKSGSSNAHPIQASSLSLLLLFLMGMCLLLRLKLPQYKQCIAII